VTSLARPDGNTTGVSILGDESDGKRQDILIEAVPGLRLMAVLTDVNFNINAAKLDALQEAAHAHTRQGHDRFFLPTAPGDLHRPGLEPRPFLRMQRALSCFVEHDPHHLISAA